MAGHVLVIDQLDNEIMELKLRLEEKGIRVTVQPNPLQAMNHAKINVPDVVVTEVLTRPVGGFEMAFAISHGKHGFIAPVIFYTEFYRDERTRRDIIAKYGAIHYFVKPFQREALKKTILTVLEEANHVRKELNLPSSAEAPLESSPSNSVHGNKREAHLTVSAPITTPQVLPAKSLPVEFLPENQALPPVTGPLKKGPEVESDPNISALVAPIEEQVLDISPRNLPAMNKENITDIPMTTPPGELRSNLLLQGESGLSTNVKYTRDPFDLPLKLIKHSNKRWAILLLFLLIGIAVLFFFWHRLGRSPMTLVNAPSFEVKNSSSPSSPPTNLASTPKEGSREGGTEIRESGSESSATPHETSTPAEIPLVSPSEVPKDTPNQKVTLPPMPELAVADISMSVREPQLIHMKKPLLTDELLRRMGKETFVVRVVIDGKGKIKEVTLLNRNTSRASLPQDFLDLISQWEFKPVPGREGEDFFKHFSFKIVSP